jgi:hypothetical protein
MRAMIESSEPQGQFNRPLPELAQSAADASAAFVTLCGTIGSYIQGPLSALTLDAADDADNMAKLIADISLVVADVKVITGAIVALIPTAKAKFKAEKM